MPFNCRGLSPRIDGAVGIGMEEHRGSWEGRGLREDQKNTEKNSSRLAVF